MATSYFRDQDPTELELLTDLELREQHNTKSQRKPVSHRSKRSKSTSYASSTSSDISSLLVKQRAKVQATKTQLEYASREIELSKRRANIEAELMKQRSDYESDLKFLQSQRDAAVAQAELEAIVVTIRDSDSSISLSSSTVDTTERTKQYVRDHAHLSATQDIPPDLQICADQTDINQPESACAPKTTPLNPTSAPFYPQRGEYSDLTKFLLKKELLLQRLTNYDDRPENFMIWKSTFKSVITDLGTGPGEEFDLLLKWLGPESKKHAVSLRTSNLSNPARGLERLWSRLHERYGCAEMVEASLKSKLAKFPKLNNKDNSKLFELSDILAEIESNMEDPKFSCLLSYFNSSSGVLPIVSKLPQHIQGKWAVRATKYKQRHAVAFPPFTEFVAFVKEMSTMLNDPGLVCKPDDTPSTHSVFSQKGKLTANNTQSQMGKKPVNVRMTQVNNTAPKCPIHLSRHSLNECRAFKRKSITERKRILGENNLCYRCCETDSHRIKDCTASIKCIDCGSDKHPSALHPLSTENVVPKNQSVPNDSIGSTQHGGEKEKVDNSVVIKCTQICSNNTNAFTGRSCSKTVLVKVHPTGKPEQSKTMYAILDDQSNRTLCKSELFETVDVPLVSKEHFMLGSCNGKFPVEGRQAFNLTVSSLDGSFSGELPGVLECDLPTVYDEIPTPEITDFYSHLEDIPIKPLQPEAKILLLIGRDFPEAHHVLEQRTGPPNTPFAQRLHFGWVIVGNVCLGSSHQPEVVNVYKTHVKNDGRSTIFPPCDSKLVVKEECDIGCTVFEQTKNDNKLALSIEDKAFIELMDENFTRDPQGKWVAPLPFRQPRPRLPNNKLHALKRAHILHKSLERNPLKQEHLVTFMAGILDNGHAEIAPPISSTKECWYLPLFGVYHPKKPDKIRGVFDSSAEFQGISLNKVLMKGPDLTNNLIGILLRFRTDKVAISCDVEQMFYSFSVAEDHRDYLRFMWYEDNDVNKSLTEYRMCKHVFGNSPSPAVATYGLRKTVEKCVKEFGSDVHTFITNNFYVDDGLTSVPSAEEAVSLLTRTQKALSTAGIRLHKFTSNSAEVLKSLPSEDLSSDLKKLELGSDTLPTQRSLGLCWELDTDTFTYNVESRSKPYTRRGILSTNNSLYDPLGILSPVTIQGKLLLRDMVSETTDWDKPLPEEFKEAWEHWESSLQDLNDFHIPRQYHHIGNSQPELHVFSDASEKIISAVAFLRSVDNHGMSQFSFVFGKSKVSPKHGHTIPRLELCAAVLAIEIAELITEELSIPANLVTFHTDSKVVLGYLTNDTRRFYIYVANRVSRIRQSSRPTQWFYINTENNPADVGTRFIAPNLLKDSIWIKGPCNFDQTQLNVHFNYQLISPNEDVEIRPEAKVMKTQTERPFKSVKERFAKFSLWKNLISAMKVLLRKAKQVKSGSGYSDDTEVNNAAETFIMKEVQREAYGNDLSKCPNELSPFFDDKGIVRVGGRLRKSGLPLSEKNPILIPGSSHVALLLTRHFHETVYHQGRHLTEGAVRAAGFWVTGGKRLISHVIYHCVKCRKLRGTLCHQKMADLPVDRVTPSPPFTYVGVDIFGPWTVLTRRTRGGSATSKRWAALFTCLTTRAIHIELVEEMTSSSFINAVRRFQSIRGKVKEFRSDRGTNFIGAADELQVDTIKVEEGPVNNLLHDSGTVWKFNSPHSSHMGGSWERMIGVVRNVLNSILLDQRGKALTHEVLSTFICEVMAIVNGRPIVPVSTDSEAPFILTPSILLTQKTGDPVETFVNPDIKEMYKSQWKHVQVLSDRFWKRWRGEFLPTLQQRRTWQQEQPNIKKDDVILLRDKSLPRNDWSVGVVNRVFTSDDDLVRKVEVTVIRDGHKTMLIRPVVDLVKLVDVP